MVESILKDYSKIFYLFQNSLSSVATPRTAACQASLSITNSRSLLKPMSIESVMASNHLNSTIPFSSCLQSFPASGSFPISQFFPSGGQSIGVSASASVLPINIQDWFPLGWTGWISLQSEELSSLLQHHSSKASIPWRSAFFIVPALTSMHDYWKNHNFTRWMFVGKVMSLLLKMLSRLVIAFPPRSKCLLISWLQSPSAVNLEPPK